MYIVPLSIIFSPIILLLKFISENLVAVAVGLFVLVIVGAIAGIIKNALDKNAAKETERQRNLDMVNSSEPEPELIYVPSAKNTF